MTSTTASVPASIDEIDPEWLTAALRDSAAIGQQARVTSVEHERIAVGTGFASSLYRTRLTLTGQGPASVIVKLPSDADVYRNLGTSTGMYAREVTYYAAVAGQGPLGAPRAFFAQRGDEPGSFALVMEDLVHLEAADHLVGLELSQTEALIDAVASAHAWSMRDGADLLASLNFYASDDPVLSVLSQLGFSAGWSTYLAHARSPLPNDFNHFGERMEPLMPALLAEIEIPRVLVHGDLRADNIFFDEVGRPTVVDYQLTRWGSGVTDVAYVLSQGVRTADRRGHDRSLIERYRSALVEHGADDVDGDLLWRQYQLATLMQVMYPLVALIGWDDMGDRARDLCLTLVERAIETALDITAFEALGDLGA